MDKTYHEICENLYTTNISTLTVYSSTNQDEWNTKEDTGKSLKMHCMYCGMPKGTSQAEATSNSEKIKSIASAVIKLR